MLSNLFITINEVQFKAMIITYSADVMQPLKLFFVKIFSTCCHFRYIFVRLDGSMSIRKRMKIVDRFNDPAVSELLCFIVC